MGAGCMHCKLLSKAITHRKSPPLLNKVLCREGMTDLLQEPVGGRGSRLNASALACKRPGRYLMVKWYSCSATDHRRSRPPRVLEVMRYTKAA